MSLEVIRTDELMAMAKSLGAADGGLAQIASGLLTKKECVAQAKMTIALMKKFEVETKKS